MKSFKDLVNDCLDAVHEIFPWDLAEELQAGNHPLLIDIREPYEYEAMHIKNSLNVPRGILESACDYGSQFHQAGTKEFLYGIDFSPCCQQFRHPGR